VKNKDGQRHKESGEENATKDNKILLFYESLENIRRNEML
jgi:hypothetical protein